MQIVAVGANQNTAQVSVREQLAFTADEIGAALERTRLPAEEAFILSTCNRVEVYALVRAGFGAGELADVLLRDRDPALAGHLYAHAGADAVRHLFSVVCGLDSLVVGEDQIIAQVKLALRLARDQRLLGPIFHRLGHDALATGKRVRSRTPISRSQLSVVSVALGVAAADLGDLRARAVLVVGAGQTGELVLKHLAGGREAPLAVANRTAATAAGLASRYGATAVGWERLEDALTVADLLVSCTSAPGHVVDAATLGRVMARRGGRPLLVLDLAVPRDVEPAAIHGLRIYDLDRLAAICAANRRRRLQSIAEAERIVEEGVERYMRWWRCRAAVPAIVSLRQRARALRDAEVARTLARLPDLTPAERAQVAYLADALVNKLLHAPLIAMKNAGDPATLAAVAGELFSLPLPGRNETGAAADGAAATIGIPGETGSPSIEGVMRQHLRATGPAVGAAGIVPGTPNLPGERPHHARATEFYAQAGGENS